MLKRFTFGFIALLLFSALVFIIEKSQGPFLILNMENKAVLPRNFRMSTDPLPTNIPNPPSTLGFAELQISGSAQFSEKSLRKVFETIPSWNIVVLDLREEPHGFLNGNAITWYTNRNWLNADLSLEQIETDEQQRLEDLSRKSIVILYKQKTIPFLFFVRNVLTEATLVKSLGMDYVRFKAQDHVKPYTESVDAFIKLIKTLPKDAWLHFHCSAGRGRTTTFMVMYDMMKNAHKVSMDEIIERHYLLGGINMLAAPPPDEWKNPYAIERSKFIQNFYQYCKDYPTFDILWSEWLKKHQ